MTRIGADAAGKSAAALVVHLADPDAHPQYTTGAQAATIADGLAAQALAAHVAAINPHPTYATGAEATAAAALAAAAAVNAHVGAINPHSQYIQTAALTQAIADAISGVYRNIGLSVDAAPYNAYGDGVHDDSAAVLAANTDLVALGGGLLYFGGGKIYRIDSQISMPYSGSPDPVMKAITWRGAGRFLWAKGAAVPSTGTVLDLRSTAAEGRIVSYGFGHLEITGFNLANLGPTATSNPFIYVTNTALQVHGNSFWGHSSKTGTACNEDCVVYGGTTTNVTGAGSTNAFQGYGATQQGNWGNRIRRMAYLRTYANSVIVRDNVVWSQSGSNLAGGAAFEVDNIDTSSTAVGNLFDGNLIEQQGYPYGFKVTRGSLNYLVNNSTYDDSATAIAAYRFEANATYNYLRIGQTIAGKALSDVAGAATTNTIVTSQQNAQSYFPGGIYIATNLVAANATFNGNGSSRVTIQPGVTGVAAGAVLFQVMRNASEGTNPAGVVWQLKHNSDLYFSDGSATNTTISNIGRTWAASGSGGSMIINTGTGGAFLDLKAFAVRYYDHTNTLRATLQPVNTGLTCTGDFKFGTAGGGLYVKEGTNATMGVATMVGGTVVVSTTKVTASSRIQLTVNSLGTVTVPKAVGVTARTAGTSFTITSADATDTSTVAWVIVEPA